MIICYAAIDNYEETTVIAAIQGSSYIWCQKQSYEESVNKCICTEMKIWGTTIVQIQLKGQA